jgi:outer membrane protein assembly factor BamB
MRLKLVAVSILVGGLTATTRADDWPQFLGPKRDSVWRETGIVDTFPKEPKVRWRKPVGQGYAGPAVAAGKVYVTDFVLDGKGDLPKSGFTKSSLAGKERVLCFDEKTGQQLWKQEYDCTYRVSYPSGTRCTPSVDGDRVYTLGTMGDLLCLDARNGDVLWKKNFLKDFEANLPIWGFAASPLVDGDKLICLVGGSDGRGVMAFDKNTGAELWKSVTIGGDPGYCPPSIVAVGKEAVRQLIIWHPGAVAGLDPETGKRLWNVPWEIRAALSVSLPRLIDGNKLFLTSFYNGSMLLKLDAKKAGIIWKSKSKGNQDSVNPDKTVDLHSIMPTPVVKDGYVYGVCSYGEFRCLKLDTGERVWATFEPTTGKSTRWGNAFIFPHEDRYFLFNEQGELIICELSPKKYTEVSRLKIIEPTNRLAGRPVVWMQPAFANKNCYARNDKEIVCVSLAK